MGKHCSMCGTIKPLSEFNKGQKRCRPCDREYQRAWRAENPERARAITNSYRQRQLSEDPQGYRRSAAEKVARYRVKHPEKVAAFLKAWKAANRARVAWRNMIERCSNPRFKLYCGRGVTVCERWKTFEYFLTDMGEAEAGMTLDRIDNDRGYEPGNCRWVTKKQQDRNKRNTIILVHQGQRKSLADWADELAINQATLYGRIFRSGWSVEMALTAAVAKRREAC